MEQQRLFSPAQAAAVLGIGRTKVYELIGRQELPVLHIGRSVRIPIEAIDAWIKRQLAEASGGGGR